MDYGYEGTPHPEDVPRPAPAPAPTQVPPPPPEPPTQPSSGSGTHQAGARPSRSPPPQHPPPQYSGTGLAPTYNQQAGGHGKGAGDPWNTWDPWKGAGKPMGKGQPYYGIPQKGKGLWDPYYGYNQYPQPKEDPIPTWNFDNPSAKLRDYLEDLAFWKRQGSVPPWKQGVKLY